MTAAARCWESADEAYNRYHDEEWGRPVVDERGLYERFCLEGFQSGLSWLTILRKRESFRSAFAGFDPDEGVAVCPRHGARIEICTGRPLSLPAVLPVETFPVRVDEGIVKVDIS